MSDESAIEWTDATWNPVRGCTKVSQGCRNCYAERFAERFRGVPGHAFEQGFDLRLVPEALELPLRWRRPRRVFVNSMSDLFHEDVPDDFIARVFAVMQLAQHHTFQVLTKRAERMRRWFDWLGSPEGRQAWLRAVVGAPDAGRESWSTAWPFRNIWLGVSVEDQRAADERIPHLLATPAAVRFLSSEPLLGPVDLCRWLEPGDVSGELAAAWPWLDWVIAGGESGPGARPCDLGWIRSLVRQCRGAGVPVFVKQLGACASDPPNGLAGAALKVPDEASALVSLRLRDRKGGDPAEWPEDLRVREFPEVTP